MIPKQYSQERSSFSALIAMGTKVEVGDVVATLPDKKLCSASCWPNPNLEKAREEFASSFIGVSKKYFDPKRSKENTTRIEVASGASWIVEISGEVKENDLVGPVIENGALNPQKFEVVDQPKAIFIVVKKDDEGYLVKEVNRR